ncbi:energy transducer TonB [Novosphingobium colocasiae]|uniref:energy transducer TonB n=1 Tax=Novosphingobium colocasiae TaxID=1256513 RepID=UPI0035B4F048
MTAPVPGIEALEAAAQAAGQRVPARLDSAPDRRLWSTAGAIALALHGGALAAVLVWSRETPPPVEEPVVLVELAAEAAPAPVPQSAAQPVSQSPVSPLTPQVVRPPLPLDAPVVKAPLPRDAVSLPPPAPAQPARAAQAPVQPAAAAPALPVTNPLAGNGSNTRADAGNDPRAQKLESDYKSLVGSYIRRNRFSPPQARKAGISGDVKVRFVVQRSGAITDVGVATSSGSALLDGEAVQFLRSLTPVPSFPRDLRKSEIPLTITLKFAVESK